MSIECINVVFVMPYTHTNGMTFKYDTIARHSNVLPNNEGYKITVEPKTIYLTLFVVFQFIFLFELKNV